MSVSFKVTVTRPSLESLFVYEAMASRVYIGLGHYSANLKFLPEIIQPGFVSSDYAESISWAEVASRKNELRADLKSWYDENNADNFSSDSETFGYGPDFNPFSLTYTIQMTYDTSENLVAGVTALMENLGGVTTARNEFTQALIDTNNTVVEETYDDGNIISNLISLQNTSPT